MTDWSDLPRKHTMTTTMIFKTTSSILPTLRWTESTKTRRGRSGTALRAVSSGRWGPWGSTSRAGVRTGVRSGEISRMCAWKLYSVAIMTCWQNMRPLVVSLEALYHDHDPNVNTHLQFLSTTATNCLGLTSFWTSSWNHGCLRSTHSPQCFQIQQVVSTISISHD